jgi:PAS domain S-box-containing protein
MSRGELEHGELAARFAAIISSSDDAIISKTVDGVITSWNPAAERIFGYTAAEAVGQHITLIIPSDRLAEEDHVLARIREGKRVDHFETVRRRKDGRHVDISLTVSPIRNAAGEVIGASKIARDISERRRYEVEREAILAREQLAREVAEGLNRSKDQFLATLSHELRTPLNAILGWAQMLASEQLDPQTSTRAKQAILRNAAAQVQLIDDLLDLSRIITGNMRLDVRPVDLRTIIEAALESVQPATQAKAIRMQTVLDPRAGPIMGDPTRLQQIIWNLVMNAVKFTPRHGQVQVHLERVQSHVELVVSDTGAGIEPDVLPHLFERFRRADSSTTRQYGGLGIGLALVRHLVEIHGGTVSAHSAGAGHGATFTVTLPISLFQPEQHPGGTRIPVMAIGRDEELKPVSLRGLKILVVDDDVDGVEMATFIFNNAGAEARGCTSASAAIEVLREWSADILVADIEMPGEDGFALLRRARAMIAVQGRRLPALALTAYGGGKDRLRVLAAGFNLHLTKPVDSAELLLAVASLLGRTGDDAS